MTSAQRERLSSRSLLTLQLTWLKNVEFAGYYLADHLGYFEDLGLEVAFEAGGTAVDPRVVVSNGQHPLGIVAETKDVIIGVSQGLDNLVIAATYEKDCSSLMVRADSGIKTIQDLRGKTIGLHPIEVDPMTRLFKASGLPRDSYVIIEEEGFGIEAFVEGQVDARCVGFWNEPVQVEMLGIRTDVIFYDPGQGDLLVTTHEIAHERPDELARYVKAAQKGWEFVVTNPEEALELVMEGFAEAGENAEQQRRQLELALPLIQGSGPLGYLGMDMAVWQDAIEFCERSDLLERPVSLDEVMTLEILDRAAALEG